MVAVVQLVEHQIVILDVAGSSPVSHPTRVRWELEAKGPPLEEVPTCPLFFYRHPSAGVGLEYEISRPE